MYGCALHIQVHISIFCVLAASAAVSKFEQALCVSVHDIIGLADFWIARRNASPQFPLYRISGLQHSLHQSTYDLLIKVQILLSPSLRCVQMFKCR